MVSASRSQRYRYGGSFVDAASGVRFEGHHPFERPDLWTVYLDEAEGRYRNFGFEDALRRRELEDGSLVGLFYLGFDREGRAVAGVRCHGPLTSIQDAALMDELASSPDLPEIARTIEGQLSLGIIEIKGAWSKGASVLGHNLLAPIARATVHSMNWLGAEFAVAAISETLLPVCSSAGARQIGSFAVPYPDDRYKTIVIGWRRSSSQERGTPDQVRAIRVEAEELSRRPAVAVPGWPETQSKMTCAFRPLVLDARTRSDREVLRVLRRDEDLRIVDRLPSQREELQRIVPSLGASVLDEKERWVYFAWRRAAVRLLGPRSFNRLRLDRNRNKLTLPEQGRLRTLRIGVVGLGAGHSIAHVLAMQGLCGELRLADFDDIELSNLNRIPVSVLDIGINKAVAAARRIAEIDPYLPVVVLREGIHEDNIDRFLDGLDIVIEECDSLDTKIRVREAARARRIPVLMETSDRGLLDVERFDLEPERPILHDLLHGVELADLEGLSTAAKGPYVLRVVDAKEITSRSGASLIELGSTVTAWPQTASEITLGAAAIAEAVRRIGLSESLPSGRVRIDLEKTVAATEPVPVPSTSVELAETGEDDLRTELDQERPHPIDAIAEAARRAPSGGNSQPWRFEAKDDEFRVYLVPERTSRMDVQHRGSMVAIGAALFNARVAASAASSLGELDLFPEGLVSHHVATLRVGSFRNEDLAQLARSVYTRASNRHPGTGKELDDESILALTAAVEREAARLVLLTMPDDLGRCAELLGESDRIRFLVPELHRELISELRWPGIDALEDGIDIRTLELEPSDLAALELARRPEVLSHLAAWQAGDRLGGRTLRGVMACSAMAVVISKRQDAAGYVQGGSAAERLWLVAEQHDLGVQPVSPVFLYALNDQDFVGLVGERHADATVALAAKFQELCDIDHGEVISLVLRLSYAQAPTVRSRRLPLDYLLSWH
jgi:hypothetical protein